MTMMVMVGQKIKRPKIMGQIKVEVMRDRLLKLIKKYESELKDGVVMDDYDGGRASALLTVIEDLNKIAEENKKPHPQQEVGVDY